MSNAAFQREMERLTELDNAVRCYLAHSAAVEQGAQDDSWPIDFWREEMERLTGGGYS